MHDQAMDHAVHSHREACSQVTTEPAPACAPGGAAPFWVRSEVALTAMVGHLSTAPLVALDTESDGLHNFPEKVCLLQMAHPDGRVYLVDPLLLPNLAPLGDLCADPAVIKVLHGASYDVASLKRDFGFTFRNLCDTMLAAQLLGLPDLGLNGLLGSLLGVVPAPSRQKDDWARRPLSPGQEAYAAGDVRHLIALREVLLAQLRAKGRESWLVEECRDLEGIQPASRVFGAEGYLELKGAKALDRRGLAVLRELFVAREAWAHEFGRPPFRLLGNEAMLCVARERPATSAALLTIPGCTAKVVDRLGGRMLSAVRRGMAVPEDALPVIVRRERPRVPWATQRRIEVVIAWRVTVAERLGLDPGVLLPRRLIERVAETAPATLEELERIDGMRHWRVESLGTELLAVLGNHGAGPAAKNVGSCLRGNGTRG